ncbi:MAG: hypothetical protein Q4B54_00960 [Coriobacteriales bacterium]|nr:hypothetical protein [Coriobacteriales bacterium]
MGKTSGKPSTDKLDSKLKDLERFENAIDNAYSTGKADRAKITRAAQLDAAEAVALAGVAMEADEAADEAMRLSIVAEGSGNRERIKLARKKAREARRQAHRDHHEATKAAKQAYDAIKFSAPNKMGFMRAVQILFALHIAYVLMSLVMSSRDTIVYNSNTLLSWIMIILEGVAFWFFINRYKIAKPFVIGMAGLAIVVSLISSLVTGTFSIVSMLFNSTFYIFLIIYFSLSKRVEATMVNDLAKRKGDYDKDELVIDRKSWPFIRNLIMYFIIFSVLGHWMEAGMCQFIRLGWVEGEYDPTNTMLWRDWLYPYPMEGAAVVIIALVLYPLKEWLVKKIKNPFLPYVISFFANALTCSLIEFSMGLVVNADYQLWDYRTNFGNVMGQVCLQNALAFGVAASVIAWFVYPMMERWIARVPRDIMNIVFVVILVIGGILWSLYIVDPPQNHKAVQPTTEEVKQKEAGDIKAGLVTSYGALEITLQDVQKSESYTQEQKDAANAQVNQIRTEINQLGKSLGLDISSEASALDLVAREMSV